MVLAGPGDIGRVTSLNSLTFDTSWYMRYRSVRLGETNGKIHVSHAGRSPAI